MGVECKNNDTNSEEFNDYWETVRTLLKKVNGHKKDYSCNVMNYYRQT